MFGDGGGLFPSNTPCGSSLAAAAGTIHVSSGQEGTGSTLGGGEASRSESLLPFPYPGPPPLEPLPSKQSPLLDPSFSAEPVGDTGENFAYLPAPMAGGSGAASNSAEEGVLEGTNVSLLAERSAAKASSSLTAPAALACHDGAAVIPGDGLPGVAAPEGFEAERRGGGLVADAATGDGQGNCALAPFRHDVETVRTHNDHAARVFAGVNENDSGRGQRIQDAGRADPAVPRGVSNEMPSSSTDGSAGSSGDPVAVS